MSLLKALRAQLGLSGTATQNFTLTAEAADGTMKLARGNAGATTQDVLTVDAAGKVAFPQNAQTCQDVTASRAHSTDYTNNTGQSIKVSVSCNSGGSTGIVSLRVAGIDFAKQAFIAGDNVRQFYAEVPNGATYRLHNLSGGVPSNITWVEIR